MKDFTVKCEACEGSGGYAVGGPCTDCYGQGEIPDDGAKLDAYDKREPLVADVIRLQKAFEEAVASDDPMAQSGICDELNEATHKLAEWKPEADEHRSKGNG